jgi:transcriptional regulator with XRE-family HTH domain
VDWHAVSDAANRRIHQLGLSKAEVARRSGLSESTIYKLTTERTALAPSNLSKVDRALDWPAGTLLKVGAEGAEPPSDVSTDPSRLKAVEDRLADFQVRLDLLAGLVEQLVDRGGEPD